MPSVTGDNEIWIGLDGWYVHNNTWNRRDLVNGTDYTQSVAVTAAGFPDGVTMEWDWPEVTNDAYVYGYPEIAIGQVPWNPLATTFDHFPVEVSNIENLDLNFDYTAVLEQGGDFNVSVSLWLSNDPDGGFDAVQNEVMIWLTNSSLNPAGSDTGVNGSDGLGSYDIWLKQNQTDASGHNDHVWDFLLPVYGNEHDPSGITRNSGTLDIDALLRVMQQNGLIDPGLWLHSVEFGPEIVQGAGSLTVNDLSLVYEETTGLGENLTGDINGNTLNGRHGNDTVSGLGGDDSLIGMSGNDVLRGGAGADTLRGGSGNDVLDAGTDAVRDLIDPGSGADRIIVSGIGGVADNVLFTSTGNKVITGSGTGEASVGHHMTFSDQRAGITLDLAAGTASSSLLNVDFTQARHFNVITGSGHADVLKGGNVAFDRWEQFTGNAGNDHFDGGSGMDAVSFSSEVEWGYWDVARMKQHVGTRGAVVNLELGTGTDAFGDHDTFANIEALIGTRFADRFTGGAENNYFVGDQGNDSLSGGGGGDSFLGGRGADVIDGGAGRDGINYLREVTQLGGTRGIVARLDLGTIRDTFGAIDQVQNVEELIGTEFVDIFRGGAAAETFSGRGGNDNFATGAGNDTAYGGAGLDTLFGGAGADQLFGGADNDRLFGADGNDMLWSDSGDDAAYGGGGNDTVHGLDGADTLQGGNGQDSVYGGAGNDLIQDTAETGVTGADLLVGNEGNDTIKGWGGNDTVAAGAGADRAFGGIGNDNIYGGDGADQLFGDAGDDEVSGGTGNDRIFGGTENDTLYGGDGADRLYGNQGDDSLHGGDGKDSVYGGYGNDVLFDTAQAGPDGNDLFRGEWGNDTIYGGGGNDTAIGGIGADLLHGGVGEDSLYGNQGNDTLNGFEDADQVFGGYGDDLLLDIDEAVNDVFRGEWGNDTIYGGGGNDRAFGGDDNDLIHGGVGHDTLFGNRGDDTLNGNDGRDVVRGGFGNDRIYDEAQTGVAGADALYGEWGNDTIVAAGGDDTVYGGSGNDGLTGGQGNDVIDGGQHDDTLWGNDGNDLLSGGAGTDMLYGGTGNDTFIGGAGDDFMRGDDGADVFRFDDASGNDTIGAFDGAGDLVDLSGISSVNGYLDGFQLIDAGPHVELVITATGQTITLNYVPLADISAADFLF
ncbi:GH12 family glycosyl hydrolase domain-containing protein [Thalassovita aquimarina]|uniref:GH12 family glycosyl hydrolase domain-containing protein n=1 Tax=Thalassovita aquimarina TaxID=2785917 RepID=UPI00356A4281